MYQLMTIHKTSMKRVWTDDVHKKSIQCVRSDDGTQEEYSVANNMVEIPPSLESGTLACRGGLIQSHSSPWEPIPIKSQLSMGTCPYQVTALHGNLSLSSHGYHGESIYLVTALHGNVSLQVTFIHRN